jgi:DNA invertase Pin-like site-specific DNA recombinase
MERPGMRALKEAIVAGRIKVLVSYKLERMLRSTDEWPSFRRFLKEYECQMVSVSEGVAEETASGRLKTNMLVSVAAYETPVVMFAVCAPPGSNDASLPF